MNSSPDLLRRDLDALTVAISTDLAQMRADLAEIRRIILELKRGDEPDA